MKEVDLRKAYRGGVPGLDPKEFLEQRMQNIAAYKNRPIEDVRADIAIARQKLRDAIYSPRRSNGMFCPERIKRGLYDVALCCKPDSLRMTTEQVATEVDYRAGGPTRALCQRTTYQAYVSTSYDMPISFAQVFGTPKSYTIGWLLLSHHMRENFAIVNFSVFDKDDAVAQVTQDGTAYMYYNDGDKNWIASVWTYDDWVNFVVDYRLDMDDVVVDVSGWCTLEIEEAAAIEGIYITKG